MARRDLSDTRTVIQQVAQEAFPDIVDTSGGALATGANIVAQIADLGVKIETQNQEARILDGVAQTELELERLKSSIAIDFQSDPQAGYRKFREERAKIFDARKKNISPYFHPQWRDQERKITQMSDLSITKWQMTQTRQNTLTAVNNRIKANMTQAMIAGQNFGLSDQEGIDALTGYFGQRQDLQGFAEKHIGPETTAEMLRSYDQDYMKMFLSGVSEINPVKALQLLDTEEVRQAFDEPGEYIRMKGSLENRALNFSKVAGEREVLNILKGENAILAQSGQRAMSYAELETALSEVKAGPYARAYFMKLNGFKDGAGAVSGQGVDEEGNPLPARKMTQQEKIQAELSFINDAAEFSLREEKSAADLAALQERLFSLADSGAITRENVSVYMREMLSPYVEEQEKTLKNFGSTGKWFIDDSTGIAAVKEFYENNLEIKGEKLSAKIEAVNLENKAALYKGYYDSLAEQAEALGLENTGKILSLPKKERNQIYENAFKASIRARAKAKNPHLQLTDDAMTDGIIAEGGLMPTPRGDSPRKADVVQAPIEIKADEDLIDLVRRGVIGPGDIIIYNGAKKAIPPNIREMVQ